ncbi:MAG: TIGR04086 family membrane protein, partial [Clostridia bacterium]|nr:TIGR04086 family membrane protein [Clostridia bacterium]
KLVFGLLLSVVFTLVMLALISFSIVRMGVLPGTVSGTLSMAAGAVGALLAAIMTARWAGEKGLLHGAVLAGGYSILYALLSVIFCEDAQIPVLAVRAVIYLLCGALGGIIGVSRKNKIEF